MSSEYGMPPSSISELSGLGQPAQQPQVDMNNADQLGANVVGLGNERAAAAEMPGVGGITKYSTFTKSDGKVMHSVEMDDPTLQRFQELAQRGANIGPLAQLAQIGQQVVEARNAQVAALKTRLAEVQAHPILAQLGRIASLAGAAYIAPHSRGEGLVRAASAFAAPLLHDTPENLTAEIAQTEQAKLSGQIPVAQLEEQAQSEQRRLEDAAYARTMAERRLTLEQKKFEQDTSNDLQTRYQSAYGRLETSAKAGQAVDKQAAYGVLRSIGVSPQQAAAGVDNLVAVQKGAVDEFDRRLKAEKEARISEQRARSRDVKDQIDAARKERDVDRKIGLAQNAWGAASDDYNRNLKYANDGKERLDDAFTQLYPGKAPPADPRQTKMAIDAALNDPKNTAAQAFKAGLESPDKFRLGLANDVAAITTFKQIEPDLKSRIDSAKALFPKDYQPPAPPPAAPPPPKVPVEKLTAMSLKDFEAALQSGQDFGHTDAELKAIYATLLKKEQEKKPAAKPAGPKVPESVSRVGNAIVSPLVSAFQNTINAYRR